MANDKGGALTLAVGGGEGGGYCFGVAAVDLLHAPSPGTVFCGVVFIVDGVDIGRELHLVAVEKHYEVGEAKIAGNAACTLGNLFLDTSVGDECIGLVGPFLAETGGDEALSDSCAHGHCVALAERAGGVFNTAGGGRARGGRESPTPHRRN